MCNLGSRLCNNRRLKYIKTNNAKLNKARKELKKVIRKFNKSQSKFYAIYRFTDNGELEDYITVIDFYNGYDAKQVMTIEKEDIECPNPFSFNATLLREVEKWQLYLSNIDDLKKAPTDLKSDRTVTIKGEDLDKINNHNPFDYNDSITKPIKIDGIKPVPSGIL